MLLIIFSSIIKLSFFNHYDASLNEHQNNRDFNIADNTP